VTLNLLPGAEPWSHVGHGAGVLLLHGFTGNPNSMRRLGTVIAAAGFSVEVPRLPGHGTTLDDMQTTGWDDWLTEADAAFERLAGRGGPVVVGGQSMGGSLALALAVRHPEVAGLVCVNPLTQPQPDEILDMVKGMVDEGQTSLPGIGSDIADPEATESAYEGMPLAPLLSMMYAVRLLQNDLAKIACPLLLLTSPQDHVVEPAQSDFLAAAVSGPVERVSLERSYHVATLDFDKDLIAERAIEFVAKVAAR
jgi:carboxylesterase